MMLMIPMKMIAIVMAFGQKLQGKIIEIMCLNKKLVIKGGFVISIIMDQMDAD